MSIYYRKYHKIRAYAISVTMSFLGPLTEPFCIILFYFTFSFYFIITKCADYISIDSCDLNILWSRFSSAQIANFAYQYTWPWDRGPTLGTWFFLKKNKWLPDNDRCCHENLLFSAFILRIATNIRSFVRKISFPLDKFCQLFFFLFYFSYFVALSNLHR